MQKSRKTVDQWPPVTCGASQKHFLKHSFLGLERWFSGWRTQVQYPVPTRWLTQPSVTPVHQIWCPLLASFGTRHADGTQTYIQGKYPCTQMNFIKALSVYHWSVKYFESRIYFSLSFVQRLAFINRLFILCKLFVLNVGTMLNKICYIFLSIYFCLQSRHATQV